MLPHLNTSALISASALLLYGVLLYMVLRRDMRSREYQFFALYLLSMIVWSLGSFMMFADLAGHTLFWNRFMIIGSTGMPVTFFCFVRAFLRRRQRLWLHFALFAFLLVQFVNVLGYVVQEAYVLHDRIYNRYGFGVNLASASWVFFVGFAALDLIAAYSRARDVLYRNRIKYLLLVVMVIFGGSLTNATPLAIYPVDIAFNGVAAMLITYAIFRHQLLDINLVVRKGLLYSIPTAIIGAAYFLIISLTLRVFHALTGTQMVLVSFIVGLIAAGLAEPLRRRAQFWVDKLFFRERYDANLMLERIGRTAASFLDLGRLTDMILDEVTTYMHISKAAFLLRQERSDRFRLVAQRGLETMEDLAFRPDHPVVRWLSTHDDLLTAHDVDVLPHFRDLWEQEREELRKLGAELFIPLKAKGELGGIFLLGPKRSEEPYSPDEQVILATLASQTAMAIDNARLYQAAQQEIAERKRAEEEREKMQSQLLLAQKMEAVGRLAGGVAHDFNNLLTAIVSYSEFLLASFDQDDPRREDAGEIKKVAERAAALTRQLLAFSRRQVLQPQIISLNDVISGLQKMLRRLIGEDIELVTVLGSGLRNIKADPGQIEQVIVNMAVNARDAMPNGGRLVIKTENVTLDAEQCKHLTQARPGHFVRLSVEDNGIGMTEDVKQHLFEPFFTTKEVGKGTGLGLAVVYGIIKQHGGWINVYSEPGHGTRFSVYLPAVVENMAEVEARSADETEELQGGGARVLVVEDEQEVRDVIRRTLTESGYVVFEAATAAQALSIYEQEHGDFDLLLSDVVLPGKSGLQLAEELTARNRKLRVLLTSGYTGERSQWDSILARGFRFLQKPYSAPELLRAVKGTLDGH